MTWHKVEIVPADCYDYQRVISEPYSVQNMEVRSYGMPAFCHNKDGVYGTGDLINTVWSDRVYEPWNKAIRAAQDAAETDVGGGFENFIRSMSHDAFVVFIHTLVREVERAPRLPVVGSRVVRHTNVSSGYPLYTVDYFGKHPDTPTAPALQTRIQEPDPSQWTPTEWGHMRMVESHKMVGKWGRR